MFVSTSCFGCLPARTDSGLLSALLSLKNVNWSCCLHALSQLCNLDVSGHLHLNRPWAGSKCKHNSAIWAVGHASPTYCCYIPGGEIAAILYSLVNRSTCVNNSPEGCYLTVYQPGVEPATLQSLVWHAATWLPSHTVVGVAEKLNKLLCRICIIEHKMSS